MITITINGTTIGDRVIPQRSFDEGEVFFNSPVVGASSLQYDNCLVVIPVGNSPTDEQIFDDFANNLGPQRVTIDFGDEE